MIALRATAASLIATALLLAAAPSPAGEMLRLPEPISVALLTPVEGASAADVIQPLDAPAEVEPLTLVAAESLALTVSPSVAALEARVRAARWECVQAGLPPNPTAGYTAGEVGNEGNAGQQGLFVGQQFIRGGKLQRAQVVALREARRLEQELSAERRRVQTDIRTAVFDAYLSQLEVELTNRLVTLSGRAVETSSRLAEAGEGRRTDTLQAEIETQRAEADRRRATQRLQGHWRRVVALTGLPSGGLMRPIDADLDTLLHNATWEETAARVVAGSPEMAARVAAISKARAVVARECVQAVPDVTAQVSVQYDDSTGDTIAGVQVGMPIPIWNRNQGGIGRAQAELTAAKRTLEATEQSLMRRLAEVYGRNQAARTLAEMLRDEVLPRAQQNLSLTDEGYRAGELGFLDLLTVQRTYFQVSLEYLDALRELNATSQLVEGCLLVGSGPGD